jgi:hypothetical protein
LQAVGVDEEIQRYLSNANETDTMSTPKFTRFRQRLEAIRAALVSPFATGSSTPPFAVRLRLEAMDERLAPSSLQADAAFPDPTAPVAAESNSQPLADSSTNGNPTNETDPTNAEPLLLPVTDPDANSEPADPNLFDTQVPGNPADTLDPWDQWWLSVDPDAEAVILFDALAFAPNEAEAGAGGTTPAGATDLASDDPEGYGPIAPVETDGGADGSAPPANEPKAEQPKSDPKPFDATQGNKRFIYNREFRVPFDPTKGDAGGYFAISTKGEVRDKTTMKSFNPFGDGFVIMGVHSPNKELVNSTIFVQFESVRVEVSDPTLNNGAWANYKIGGGVAENVIIVHPKSKWEISILGTLSMDTREKGKGSIQLPGIDYLPREEGAAALLPDAPQSARNIHDLLIAKQPKGSTAKFRVTATYYAIVVINAQPLGYLQYTAQMTTGEKKITYGNANVGSTLFSKELIGEMTQLVNKVYPDQKELRGYPRSLTFSQRCI